MLTRAQVRFRWGSGGEGGRRGKEEESCHVDLEYCVTLLPASSNISDSGKFRWINVKKYIIFMQQWFWFSVGRYIYSWKLLVRQDSGYNELCSVNSLFLFCCRTEWSSPDPMSHLGTVQVTTQHCTNTFQSQSNIFWDDELCWSYSQWHHLTSYLLTIHWCHQISQIMFHSQNTLGQQLLTLCRNHTMTRKIIWSGWNRVSAPAVNGHIQSSVTFLPRLTNSSNLWNVFWRTFIKL